MTATGHWLRRIRRNKMAAVSAAFLLLVVVCAVFAGVIAPDDPSAQSSSILAAPSGAHLLGTDTLGRDTLSRIIYGSRVSLEVSVAVVLISLAISLPVGIYAGYRRGRFDAVVMRIAEAGISIPALVLALAVVSFLGASTESTIWALTVVSVPGFVRVVRGQARAVCQRTFVDASRSIGTHDVRIMIHRVLPSVWPPVIVQSTIYLGVALLAEAALSYLGLGTKLPTPSWGGMLQEAEAGALFTAPWQVVFPGVAIVLTVLSFNGIGEGLRAATGTARQLAGGRERQLGITAVEPLARTEPSHTSGAEDPADLHDPLLRIRDLTVQFRTDARTVRVVEGLNLTIKRGEILGLVGESGSGKSVTAMSIMRLLKSPPAQIVSGHVELDGLDLLRLPPKPLRSLRGRRVSMIFQDPMTSLDPAFTVGHHLREAQRNHRAVSRRDADKRSIELLDMVGIGRGAERLNSFAHEFSGGMRQRVMIAIALANEPELLIADEPTTALDVTVQDQILGTLRNLQREFQMSLLFVTHDLGVIADICDRVAVMYAGQIVETANVDSLFETPQHPYTKGLLAAMPRAGQGLNRLREIPGMVPMAGTYPGGCRFHDRCPFAEQRCAEIVPELLTTSAGGAVRCIRYPELSLVDFPEASASSEARRP